MRGNGDDFPVLRGTVTIRSPRSVLLLLPMEFCLALSLWLAAVVFTIWPEALEHAPVSFEQRGVVHHVWHYALLLGATAMLWGLFSAGARRLLMELMGVCLALGCLGLNLIALVADAISNPMTADVGGLDIAFRAGFILGLGIRTYIIIREPIVHLGGKDGE